MSREHLLPCVGNTSAKLEHKHAFTAVHGAVEVDNYEAVERVAICVDCEQRRHSPWWGCPKGNADFINSYYCYCSHYDAPGRLRDDSAHRSATLGRGPCARAVAVLAARRHVL